MNKILKKRISVLLCVTMLLCNNMSFFSFADIIENNVASMSITATIEENNDELKQNDNTELSSDSEPDESLDVKGNDGENSEGEGEENIPEPEDDMSVDLSNTTSPSEAYENKDKLLEENLDVINKSTLSDIINNDKVAATASETKNTFYSSVKKKNVATTSIATISNITENEVKIYSTGYISSGMKVGKLPEKRKGPFMFSAAPVIPAEYDSRNENVNGMSIVPDVRNQYPYGTCWAFATLGLLEISARKKGLVTNESDSDLSEAALSYFYYHLKNVTNSSNIANNEKPGVEGNDYIEYNDWTEGGNPMMALFTMSSYMGAVKENADTTTKYSYMPNLISGSTINSKYAFNNNILEVNNVKFINKNDTNTIKQAIIDNGAVSMAYFDNGYETGSHCVKSDNEYYYLSTESQAGHAIAVVGWNDNIDASNFPHGGATNNGAWLVRNSWGSSSRNNGYFWLSYDEPSIDEVVVAVDVVKANTYKYNYHYDTVAYGSSVAAVNESDPTNKQYIGNVFKVSNDEDQSLDAISVGVESLNAKFDIEIYISDSAMSSPNQGTLKLVQSNCTTTTAGIYTIPLNTKIPLKKNTYYSIVLKPKDSKNELGQSISNTRFYVDNIDIVSDIKTYSAGSSGECFKWQYNAWHDIDIVHSGVNARFVLKGLTNPYTFPTQEKQEEKKEEYHPSGGSGGNNGGGGGGGGGGKITMATVTPFSLIAPKQSEAKVVSNVTNTAVLSMNVAWSFDPVLNTWSLNPDNTNIAGKATNGIYTLVSLDTRGNIVADSYYFDTEGHMVTGWVKDSKGNTYFFNANQGADIGKMSTGWKEIGTGEWYYFSSDGKLAVNTVTADGYKVDAEGKWIK